MYTAPKSKQSLDAAEPVRTKTFSALGGTVPEREIRLAEFGAEAVPYRWSRSSKRSVAEAGVGTLKCACSGF